MYRSEEQCMHRLPPQATAHRSRTLLVGALCVACSAVALSPPVGAAPLSSAGAAAGSASAAEARLARSHLDKLSTLAKTHVDEALCAVIASSEQLQQALGEEFLQRREKIYERSPDDVEALKRLDVDVAGAVDRLPGVGLSVGAETIYHYVRYGALSSYVPHDSPVARALRLAGGIWPDPAGSPISFEPSTDVAGCWRPSAVVTALRALAGVWASVPTCLKSQLRPKLVALQDDLTRATCYCDDKEKTVAALGEIGTLSEVFAEAGAPPPAAGGEQQQQERSYSCR